MNKKADLSMNMIIVAALALLVLVTISLIFFGRANTFNKQAKGCESNGGICVDQYEHGSCQGYASQRDLYDTGRERTDLVCYDGDEPRDGYICCTLM